MLAISLAEAAESIPTWWLIIGFAGQACFALRFLVQWLATERARNVVVPASFWYISLAGTAFLFAYGVLRRDPVILVGQAFGCLVYVRNLYIFGASSRSAA
jgi:lipid-A-disaccharide synthase-like uncharacterized protein